MIAEISAAAESLTDDFGLDQIKIDKDFKTLCPGLLDDELRRLKENIVKDGEFRDPLIVWSGEGILIDGHNRMDVWRNLSGEQHAQILAPKIKLMEFENREAAHNWIIANQLGRRNLSAKDRSYLVGKRYQAEKKNKDANLKQSKTAPKPPKGENCPSGNTAENIGKEVGKSPRQVKDDSAFATAVDAIAENVGPETKSEILANKKLSKTKIVEIAKLPPEKQQAEFDRAMGRGEPSGGTSFDPSEWGGYDTVEEPVVASDVVTEHHLKEMQAPFREVQKLATKLKKAIANLPTGPGAAWYGHNTMQDINACYLNLMSAIKYTKPVAICGYCGGKKCDRCFQTGALNKDRSDALKDGREAVVAS